VLDRVKPLTALRIADEEEEEVTIAKDCLGSSRAYGGEITDSDLAKSNSRSKDVKVS
jgi:hypothetical protein